MNSLPESVEDYLALKGSAFPSIPQCAGTEVIAGAKNVFVIENRI
jgi:hypothetical protein